MKKIISTLMVLACLIIAMPAQAQIKFGLKGGLDVTKISLSDSPIKGDNATGFFVGPMMEFTLPVVGLGFDVAALYSQSGMKFEGVDETEKLKSIEVPVNLKWTAGLGSTLGVFVAAGPQFGFGVGDGWEAFDSKKCFVSINIGAGLKLLRHLQLGVNYNIGASKVGDMVVDKVDGWTGNEGKFQSSLRKNSWQISLAYMF